MKHIKNNYDKVQNTGMYCNTSQKEFIDDLINKFNNDITESQIDTLSQGLFNLLSNIPSKDISNADLSNKNYPWFIKGHSSCSNFTIFKPKRIIPFGFPIQNIIERRINLLLILDPSTFNPKDHLNYRYLNKRNATLHYFCDYLNQQNNKKTLEWNKFSKSKHVKITLEYQSDHRKVAIKISKLLESDYSIMLFAGYDDGDLNFNRKLTFANNCIRPQGVTDVTSLPITPTYNYLIFEDSTYLTNHELLSDALIQYKNLHSAILLMKLWLERDEVNSSLLNQFPYYLVMAHVCKSRNLSESASNYQIFSSTIHFIANFKINSIHTYGSNVLTDKNATQFDFPILLDSHGYNILWRCFLGFPGLIIRSKEAVFQQSTFTNNMHLTRTLFVNRVPISTRYSLIAKLEIINSNIKIYTDKYEDQLITDFMIGLTDYELSAISTKSILKLALSDRLDSIDFITLVDGSINVLLNFNVIYRKVDKGVLSNGDLANAYSKFWGGITETRVFAGHQPFICILPSKISQCNDINISITRYILESNNIKFTIINNYQSIYRGLNDGLQDHNNKARGLFEPITGILFSLNDKNVPLRVSRVTLLDSTSYSHTDYWLPYSVYVQMESSSAWPKEPIPIKYVTTAFYLSMHKEIISHSDFKAIDSRKLVIPTWNHLEIIIDDCIYNLTIDGPGSEVPRVNRLEAIKAMSQREASFGPAVKLVKEWLANNLIPDADELIETLAIHVYNTNTPKSISCGFYKILNLLNTFDWSSYTLIVHLDSTTSDVVDKMDSLPISMRIDDYKIQIPNPYLISILLHQTSKMLGDNRNDYSVNKDFTIVLNNPYNSMDVKLKREGQFIIRSFIQTLKDKFPYLILLYNQIKLNGINENVFINNITDSELHIYCKINPLTILTMSIPYLTITNNQGLIAVNIPQIISELTTIGHGLVRDIKF